MISTKKGEMISIEKMTELRATSRSPSIDHRERADDEPAGKVKQVLVEPHITLQVIGCENNVKRCINESGECPPPRAEESPEWTERAFCPVVKARIGYC